MHRESECTLYIHIKNKITGIQTLSKLERIIRRVKIVRFGQDTRRNALNNERRKKAVKEMKEI